MVDPRRFVVCGTCGDLFETSPRPGFPTPQRCMCHRRDAADPKWDRYDFNEHLHLCRCCRSVALSSGSRWSVWFCGECKQRVLALNRAMGGTVVPIGRHTLMAGVSVSGSDLAEAADHEVAQLVDGFHAAAMGLFDAMHRLEEFAHRRTRELRNGVGFKASSPVALPAWLEGLRVASHREPERFGKQGSFELLVRSLHHEDRS